MTIGHLVICRTVLRSGLCMITQVICPFCCPSLLSLVKWFLVIYHSICVLMWRKWLHLSEKIICWICKIYFFSSYLVMEIWSGHKRILAWFHFRQITVALFYHFPIIMPAPEFYFKLSLVELKYETIFAI
jgi:hypothetical protein